MLQRERKILKHIMPHAEVRKQDFKAYHASHIEERQQYFAEYYASIANRFKKHTENIIQLLQTLKMQSCIKTTTFIESKSMSCTVPDIRETHGRKSSSLCSCSDEMHQNGKETAKQKHYRKNANKLLKTDELGIH